MGWLRMRPVAWVLMMFAAACFVVPAAAQDEVALGPGTLYVVAEPVVVGATVPCDSALYTMAEEAPPAGKAYTARSFGGAACTTSLDFAVPRDFVASSPITIRAILGCDQPAGSAGVSGATTSVRFQVFHDGSQVGANINLVGSNTCGPGGLLTYQASADLGGEEFAAGDVLRINMIPFYTTGGAGDPNRNLHFVTGGADPSVVIVPDLGGVPAAAQVLYQNVTGPELRAGRNETANLTQLEVYNWTAADPAELTYEANVTSGQILLRVADMQNETILNLTIAETGNATLPAGGPGNLTLWVQYENFTGSFVVQMTAAPPPPLPPASNTTTTSEVEATGGFPLRRDEETPGVTLVPLLAVVALAATAVRRRLP